MNLSPPAWWISVPAIPSLAKTRPGLLALPAATTVGALGIVYGDIGTSPLYAFRAAIKAASVDGSPTPEAVLGAISLIIWSLILVVSLKYAILILRADNRGEGGIVALLALLHARRARPGTWRGSILVVGVVGAALLYGDGAITPAISVLSAVEGLKEARPVLAPAVLPITCVILVGLFFIQKRGTGSIGKLFGPVMLIWFSTIGALGAYQIFQHPAILAALGPQHAVRYFAAHGLVGAL